MNLDELEITKVNIDTSKYEDFIDACINNESYFKKNKSYAIELKNHLLKETNTNINILKSKILGSIKNMKKWNRSTIAIIPHFIKYDFDYENGCGDFSVYVYNISTKRPDFTYFSNGKIDDVLDAGDDDFFNDPLVEEDYFNLINSLSGTNVDKDITLFTARKNNDRSTFHDVTSIPTNIFLTSSYDEAYGYAIDFGDRDIYEVKINSAYITKTLDANGIQNYQTFSSATTVPVVYCELIYKSPIKESAITQSEYYAFYTTTLLDSYEVKETNNFPKTDGGLGKGVYISGTEYSDDVDKINIEVSIRPSNPLIIKSDNYEEFLDSYNSLHNGHDAVLWLDYYTGKIKSGVVFDNSLVSYINNPHINISN